MDEPPTRAGYVALLGRPNAGKSTLLNRLVQRKVSITAHKPQTTRHAITGIRTTPEAQIVFVDTPGLHRHAPRAMNRYLNRVAGGTLSYVDAAVFVVEALRWTDDDQEVLERLAEFPRPVLLAVNKVDRLADKSALLPGLQGLAAKRAFAALVPISALKGDNVEALAAEIVQVLPPSEPLYPGEQITTAGERFMAAEILREKLTWRLHQELPYALTVAIEHYEETPEIVRIAAVIWVEREGQVGMVVGAGGTLLKEVGQQARLELERLLGRRVFLQTWVKVRAGWADDARALHSLGYVED